MFAVLAYGEISAFYRLAEDARMAPTLAGTGRAREHGRRRDGALRDAAQGAHGPGIEVYAAMDPFVRALDAYHASTDPSTWLESLVKAYVGDGIAADFYLEIAHSLDPTVGGIVREVLAEVGHSEFVVQEVRAAVAASKSEKDRLMLWGRRLLGEAITQAQFVLARREDLTDLVMTATGSLNGVAALFDNMQAKHAERMAVLGLV
ncbi:hydroxylase [Rhodococcus hoagii]|nr:hydroxylase [Prescottella equi]